MRCLCKPVLLTSLVMLSILGLTGASANATDQDHLRAQIIAGGTNETDSERHTVDVSDCTMTTFRWHNHRQEGWILWSSFKFAMSEAVLTQVPDKDGVSRRYLFVPAVVGETNDGIAMVFFEMRAPETALFERSNKRKLREGRWPSPRGDGTTHHYFEVDDFMVVHNGSGVGAKAEIFTNAYVEYVQKYCIFIS